MSIPDHQLVLSARFLRRSFAFACAALLLMGSSAKASSTVLAFGQLNPLDTITASESGGVTTLSTAGNADGGGMSVPVVATNYLGVPQPFGLLMFETFVNVHSTGVATNVAGTISQNYTGEIDFTVNPGPASGSNPSFLVATFSGPNGTFSGGAGGGSANLGASEPSDTVTFTSTVSPGLGGLTSNAALALSFSGITPGLGITGGSVASFGAQNAGTFSASTSVPEPGTLCLASFAVVIGTLTFRRKVAKV